MTLFSKEYLTTNVKIYYKTSCTGKFSEKKTKKKQKNKKTLKDVSRTIATAKMELSVVLVISFQPLNNFTKNPNISATGVLRSLNASLEYYNHRNYISML